MYVCISDNYFCLSSPSSGPSLLLLFARLGTVEFKFLSQYAFRWKWLQMHLEQYESVRVQAGWKSCLRRLPVIYDRSLCSGNLPHASFRSPPPGPVSNHQHHDQWMKIRDTNAYIKTKLGKRTDRECYNSLTPRPTRCQIRDQSDTTKTYANHVRSTKTILFANDTNANIFVLINKLYSITYYKLFLSYVF